MLIEYVKLFQEGDSTIKARRDLLMEARVEVQKNLDKYQEEGKPAQELKEGTVIVIPPNVKHWHGAKKDSWFSHISLEVPGENTSNEWLEPISDKEYDVL